MQIIGLRNDAPVPFCNVKPVPVAEEIFQLNVLKETFPESLENKMLL